MHIHRLVDIEYLHKQLHDLLLDVVAVFLYRELGLTVYALALGDVVSAALAIPHGPVGIESVIARIGSLVGT